MKLSVTDQVLNVKFTPLEKVVGLKSSFSVPLTNIVKVSTATPRESWKELRAPGTYVPGVIKAGTYYTDRGKEYWHLRRSQPALTIELSRAPYSRVVLGIKNAKHWAEVINNKIRKPRKK